MKPRWKSPNMRRCLSLVLFILAGCLGNYSGISLIFGSDFLFGSAAVMVALYYFGLPAGMFVAIMANSVTCLSWGHPYAVIIFSLEILFVGLLLRRRRGNLLLLDGLFWLTVGIPLVFLFHGYILNMGATATSFVALKQAVNGIFNALVASLIINYLPVQGIIGSRSEPRIVSLSETLFNALVAFVLLPSLLIMFQDSRDYAREMERETVEDLRDLGVTLTSHLKMWHSNLLRSVEELAAVAEKRGVVPSENLQHDLELIMRSSGNFLGSFIANSEGRTVAHSPPLTREGKPTLGLYFGDRPYFQEMRITKRPALSEVIDGRGGLPVRIIALSAPILEDGQFQGCATGALDLSRIRELVSLYAGGPHLVARDVTITDPGGRVIVSSVQGRESPQYFKPGQNGLSRPIADSVYLYTPDVKKDLPSISRWKNSFYTFEKRISGEIPWTLIIESPVAPMQEILFRKQSQVFLTASVLAILALLLAIVLSRRISHPLTKLSEVTADFPHMISNHHSIEWPKSATTEIYNLTNHFQTMSNLLERNFRELSEHGAQLTRLNVELQLEVRERKQAEDALRESEERFRFAMSGANDGIWDWNLGTSHVYYSLRWKSMLGYAEEELEHHLDTWKRLVHPEDLGPSLAMATDLLDGRVDKFEIELRMRHKDGHFVDILSRALMVRSSEGEALRLVGTHVDISERKRAQEALRQARERNESVLSNINDAYIVYDREWQFLELNEAAVRAIGRSREELPGRSMWEVFPDIIGTEIETQCRSAMELRLPVRFEYYHPPTGKWWDNRFYPAGEGLAVFSMDITERKDALAELFDSEQRFRQFAENSEEAIWIADRLGGGYVFVNPAYETIWGRPCENGRAGVVNFLDSIVEEDRKRVIRRLSRQARGIFEVDEYAIKRPDGSVRWIRDRAFPLRDKEGRICYVAGISEDITARKVTEAERIRLEAQMQQAQKMEALGTLAGGIAHDFNNILGIISGFTEMIDWDLAKDNTAHGYIREVMKATHRARDLVKQILTFSRRNEEERYPVQVGLVVKEALKMLRASLPATIEIQVDVTSNELVLADPTQMHQVLLNLCTNAAYAMQEQGGVLAVSLTDVCLTPETAKPHGALPPGPYIMLTVKDSGHGIDVSILHRIFDPFFTTKGPGSGTGLGLSVVHGIAKSHGGTVEVESIHGKGSTFRVFLPVTDTTPETPTMKIDPLACGQERVLVVDDEPALASALRLMLKGLGYEVECETICSEAIETFYNRLQDNPFDLVITDMTMPFMSGEELSVELRKLQPNLPIIVCTGFSEKLNGDNSRGLGFQGFLMKPVALGDLADLVRKVLDGTSH